MARQFLELGRDGIQPQTDFLCEHDEGHAPKRCARVAAMSGRHSLGMNESASLIKAQCRCRNATALCEFTDRKFVLHCANSAALTS